MAKATRMSPEALAYHQQWRDANREKVREASRRSYAKHRSERCEAARRRREENIEAERARHREIKRKARADRPGDLRDQYKAWRHRFPEKQILHQARARARKKGIPFDLAPEDVVIPERCPILGIRLVLPRDRGAPATGFGDESPSLDRIDNARGYVRGNVWVISWRANRIKGDATLDELENVVRALRAKVTLPPPKRESRSALQLPLPLPPPESPARRSAE